jgi:hypothetical protein
LSISISVSVTWLTCAMRKASSGVVKASAS